RPMFEFKRIKIPAQFPIDPAEQIKIEITGDTLTVIVCFEDNFWVFFQIKPSQQHLSGTECLGEFLQQPHRLSLQEITEIRSQEQHQGRPLPLPCPCLQRLMISPL